LVLVGWRDGVRWGKLEVDFGESGSDVDADAVEIDADRVSVGR
jgi:hypothetical protein